MEFKLLSLGLPWSETAVRKDDLNWHARHTRSFSFKCLSCRNAKRLREACKSSEKALAKFSRQESVTEPVTNRTESPGKSTPTSAAAARRRRLAAERAGQGTSVGQ